MRPDDHHINVASAEKSKEGGGIKIGREKEVGREDYKEGTPG